MSFEIVRDLSDNEWRTFVESHPDGNIFHTPEMFQVFSRTKFHRPELWAAKNNERVLALFLPVSINLLTDALRRFTTRNIVYGSVLCTSHLSGQQALQGLLQAYKDTVKHKVLFSELRNLTDYSNLRGFLSEQEIEYQDHLNYLIDLNRSPDEIFNSIGARTRKNIRRGLKRQDVIINEITEFKQIEDCYQLLHKTYQRAQVPLADRSLFENAFTFLYPKGMIRITMALVGQEPAATSVELLYKDRVFGWYGGMDRAFSSYSPNEILMWQILKWGAENGYHIYDFGGAGIPGEDYGVRDFKAKFGGNLVNFGRFRMIHSPNMLRLSEFGYGLFRRFL